MENIETDVKNESQNLETSQPAEFIRPRHWVDLDELTPEYWANEKKQELRGQEFLHKPIETLEKIEAMDKAGFARRDFLTVMGASMALASCVIYRRPVNKIIPYAIKPEQITPGIPTWYASTHPETGYGVLIKNREGRPIKLEGNPDHPLNRGKLSAQVQGSLLDLYDPNRLKSPLSSGKEVSWDEVNQQIADKLKQAARSSQRVRIISKPISSPSTRRLIKEFLSGFMRGEHVELDPLGYDVIAEAQRLSYGKYVIPGYRFDQAKVVVSLGADFLGSWLSPVEFAKDWSKNRKLDSNKHQSAELSKLYTFESTMTVTGSNSDERHAIRPGDELKIALALAHELIVIQKHGRFAQNGQVGSFLQAFSPKAVAADIWGSEEKAEAISKIAKHLAANAGKSLVVGGTLPSRDETALDLQLVINLLNSALQNEGETVDGGMLAQERFGQFDTFNHIQKELEKDANQVVIFYDVNPSYYFPGFSESLKNVSTVITVAHHLNETAKESHFVLPSVHFLESWGDSNPRQGVYSLQQPALAPLHGSHPFQDCLIAWSKATGLGKQGLLAKLGANQNWYNYVQANWQETTYSRFSKGMSSEEFWVESLRKGAMSAPLTGGIARNFNFVSRDIKFTPSTGSVKLGLYTNVKMGDGEQANNAWLQELPDPISTITWDNFLNIAPSTAAKMHVKENDVIEVSIGDRKFDLPAHVQPGLHAQAATMAVGYGRKFSGEVGNEIGVNAFAFLNGTDVTLRRTGRRYELAATQGHSRTMNRPIINDITLEEFKKNPAEANHTNPHLRAKIKSIWPVHEYKGYRWAMSIDLNSCTGCGACVVACQAENNVPVVGRDRVRMSREMHWIRIDRYYSGSEDNPEVVFQPMMCQHCENASCETVCPVLATVHSSEGLSEMAYNRCVGTRYCQNNCPYKVRRFNFFDHWKEPTYKEPMNKVWNPDVTVRTRGVMEKCSFCVQRIQFAKDRARKPDGTNAPIKDGDFTTACAQTCPTDAITFGNVNDAESKVKKDHTDQRSFRVLEEINNKPMIAYLSKVRNKEKGVDEHGHH